MIDTANITEVVSAIFAVIGTVSAALATQKSAKQKTQAAASGTDERLRRQLILDHIAWDQEVSAMLSARRMPFRSAPNLDALM